MRTIKVEDLAQMMGITKAQLEEQLKNNDVIELKLTERKKRKETKESGNMVVM